MTSIELRAHIQAYDRASLKRGLTLLAVTGGWLTLGFGALTLVSVCPGLSISVVVVLFVLGLIGLLAYVGTTARRFYRRQALTCPGCGADLMLEARVFLRQSRRGDSSALRCPKCARPLVEAAA